VHQTPDDSNIEITHVVVVMRQQAILELGIPTSAHVPLWPIAADHWTATTTATFAGGYSLPVSGALRLTTELVRPSADPTKADMGADIDLRREGAHLCGFREPHVRFAPDRRESADILGRRYLRTVC